MGSSKQSGFSLQGRSVLGSLVSQAPSDDQNPGEMGAEWVPIGSIKPNPQQPRQVFSEEGITSLANSFRKDGFRGALNVRKLDDGLYQIVAGERRWRAAKQAGLESVRCIIDDYSDEEALEFALVENLQREDLSKLEETEGILKLIESKLHISREQALSIIRVEGHPDRYNRDDLTPSEAILEITSILEKFGISLQTFRTKNLRTLALPEEVKQAHLGHNLSYSCALEISKVKDKAERAKLLAEALEQKLPFREVKSRVRQLKESSDSTPSEHQAIVARLEENLKRAKRATQILDKPQKRKRLERLLEQLDKLLDDS